MDDSSEIRMDLAEGSEIRERSSKYRGVHKFSFSIFLQISLIELCYMFTSFEENQKKKKKGG